MTQDILNKAKELEQRSEILNRLMSIITNHGHMWTHNAETHESEQIPEDIRKEFQSIISKALVATNKEFKSL